MGILKFKHCFIILFCFCSLYTIVYESHEVVYKKKNKKEKVQYLACEKLTDLHPYKTKIDFKELRDDLYGHLNSSDDNFASREENPRRFEELILSQAKSGGYLILNGMICLIAKDGGELLEINNFLSFELVYFAIQRETFDLVKMNAHSDKIDQLTVQKKKHLFPNCSESNNRFICLNKCFKRNFRLARYFYHGNETGLIHLNYSHTNQTIKDHEKNCFRKCEKENCKLVQLIPVDESKEVKSETFEARLKLSEFDYWLQLIGLVCMLWRLIFSFIGFLLNNKFTSITAKLKKSKEKRKVRIFLFCLKLTIFLLNLASFGLLGTLNVLDYEAEKTEGITKILTQPKIVHLAICVNMGRYVGYTYENKTLSELERATDGALKDILEGIHVNYQDRLFRTDYKVQPKALFERDPFDTNYRCFLLFILPNYQMIPSQPKLTITFKKYFSFNLYLLSENENLNSKSFKYSNLFAFMKRVVKRSSGSCVDYQAKYKKCTGRWNCVNRCIGRKFMKRFNRTTLGTEKNSLIIDRDLFSSTEWKTSELIGITEENGQKYENIIKKCLKTIPEEKPCMEIKFEAKEGIYAPMPPTKEIDLDFDVLQTIEESPSSHKLVLELLSIYSIFFDLTVFKLLMRIYKFIQTILIIRRKKAVLFAIYLLCSIGASLHIYCIFDLVVSRELASTEHYELAKEIQIPVMVFCDPIDQRLIDENHKLTGDYLEKLTRESTAERMFSRIAYLNESNEWAPFDLSQAERFFLLDMKCFRIQIDQAYHRNQFHFSTESQVIKVGFNKTSSAKESKFIYFMTKSKETAKFSKITILDYSTSYYNYLITHETSLYVYEDRFSFIRRRFRSFKEDDTSDLNELLFELRRKEHNLRTLNLPMEEDALMMEVDEDLFEQLYSIQKNLNKRTDLNYKQLFVSNHLRKVELAEFDLSFGLIFLKKIVSSTNEENYGMFILSLLNVLSIWFDLCVIDLHQFFLFSRDHLLVYLYLHLPVFLIDKITQSLIFSCKWLKKLEFPLYDLLKPRKRKKNLRKPRRF